MANLISTTGPICPNVTDTPLDNRSRVSTIVGIGNIPLAWKGMLVYCEENGKTYKVTSLKPKTSGPVVIENYYPATWIEFGSGGGTPSPSPSPSAASAGDITYENGGSYSTGTVGSKLNEIGNLNDLEITSNSIVEVINLLKQAVEGKISGIIVDGQQLPIEDGVVTIPAGGGGGTGTITGATVGGNPVTASGGILQFDAYPTVPITSIETSDHTPLAPNNGLVTLPAIPAAPTADTMQYSGSTNYSTGSIGKEVKELNTSITDLSTKVADLDKDKPSPTPSSSITTVNLASYTTSGSSFTYDVDNKYIYNTKDTTFYQYSEESNNTTVYYGVFKVIGEDRYLMYSITNNTTFTYSNTYTELTLPENAKKEFALGSVAVVKRVNGEGESWKNGTVNLFCTKQNMPLRNRCRKINFNGSTAWRVLIKSEDGNTIFVYKAKSNGNYEWEINVPRSSTANFNLLDKYFDRPEASNVSFDDSITQLGTSQDPVDNVQKAINVLTTAVVSGNCILSVNLKDFDGTDIASEYIGLSYVLNGNTVVLSDLSDTTPAIATDSNGIAHAVIPYGAQYTIVFNTRSNRQAIPSYTSIADINHINLFRYYNKEADKELVIIQVMVKNANNADLDNYSLQNKEVYIDYLNNVGTVVTEAAITCYLNVRGRIETWQESGSATVHTYSEDPIYINKGQYYRVRLQEWSPSLPSDEQELIKSENKSRLAQDYTKSFQMFYTYKKAGIFFVVEDYNDDTDLNTYTEYLCEDYDDTNHTVTIIDNETSNRYILKYDASEGGIVRALSTDPTNFILWISTSNMSKVLGIGVRTSDTINNNLEYNAYESYGYVDCSFLIPRNVATVTKKMQDTAIIWSSLPINNSGKAVTMFMAESASPYSEMAQYLTTQMSLKTGTLTQVPFIPSPLQARVMTNNKIFIKNALLVLNNTLFNNVQYTITTQETNNGISFSFTNIYGTSSTPINKTTNQNVIPIYCF